MVKMTAAAGGVYSIQTDECSYSKCATKEKLKSKLQAERREEEKKNAHFICMKESAFCMFGNFSVEKAHLAT